MKYSIYQILIIISNVVALIISMLNTRMNLNINPTDILLGNAVIITTIGFFNSIKEKKYGLSLIMVVVVGLMLLYRFRFYNIFQS